MVFGFLTRKSRPGSLISIDDNNTQLRTPSPSVASHDPRQSPAPAPPASPSPPPIPSADELSSLLAKIPPVILYDYTITHLPNASLGARSFFAQLRPPPARHCVRCHSEYFDVENTDRSCTMPHDDDSAEVFSVKGRGRETLWQCCGKTVEGDGDMGPPDGWCYEGFHTIDVKRARFRADSTIKDDKLPSCQNFGCAVLSTTHEPSPIHTVSHRFSQVPHNSDSASHRLKRVRTQSMYEREEESSGASDSGIEDVFRAEPSIPNLNTTSILDARSARLDAQREDAGDNYNHTTSKNVTSSRGKQKARNPRGRTPKKVKYISDVSMDKATTLAHEKSKDTLVQTTMINRLNPDLITQSKDRQRMTGQGIHTQASAPKMEATSTSTLHTPENRKAARKHRI